MKFVVLETIILVSAVTLLLYLLSLNYFLPYSSEGSINWYNIAIFLGISALVLQAFIALLVYLFQKIFVYGKHENPPYAYSLRIGIISTFALVIIAFLNILHIFSYQWGLALVFIIIVGFILIKW